jgi:DNA-binding NtrC family response regulator
MESATDQRLKFSLRLDDAKPLIPQIEVMMIRELMQVFDGRRRRPELVARKIGWSLPTLYKKMHQYGMDHLIRAYKFVDQSGAKRIREPQERDHRAWS